MYNNNVQNFFGAKKNQVSPEKQELFKKLIKEYDLKTATDLQNMMKEMFAPMLQSMLEGELDGQPGYEQTESYLKLRHGKQDHWTVHT